jgi:hypothetical protein
MENTKSLSALLTLWAVVALAVGMVAYAAIEHATGSSGTTALVAEHTSHVLVFGLLIYGVMVLVVRRVLVAPLVRIRHHLYSIGAGRVELLDMKSRVTEVSALIGGINRMVARMTLHADAAALDRCRTELDALHRLAQSAESASPALAGEILTHAAALRQEIARAALR